jgi:hypothetical protein
VFFYACPGSKGLIAEMLLLFLLLLPAVNDRAKVSRNRCAATSINHHGEESFHCQPALF